MFLDTVDKNKIVKLGIDAYRGSTGNFSRDDAEEALRKSLLELCGGEKFDRKAFRRNKIAVFEIIEEILQVLITEGIETEFDPFVEYRNVNYGDQPVFTVQDYKLFPVAMIADGTNNIRRQTLDREAYRVEAAYRGVKIYEDFEYFLTGRNDWRYWISKVQRSFNAKIAADIYNAIVQGYTALSAPYKYAGTWDITQFNTLYQHVYAATRRDVTVAGTRLALQKTSPAYVSYNIQAIDQRNRDGWFKIIDGIKMVELKQAHDPGSDNFAISDNFLLFLPDGEEKIVKLIIEGQPEVREITNFDNSDDSVEYMFKLKYGVGVVTSTRYGAYLLS